MPSRTIGSQTQQREDRRIIDAGARSLDGREHWRKIGNGRLDSPGRAARRCQRTPQVGGNGGPGVGFTDTAHQLATQVRH
jgi:hypothetical protein